MAQTVRGEVIHVVDPDDRDEFDLTEDLRTLAESRYILVCREGGSPSWFERIRSFLARTPIKAVTIVADTEASEGEEVTATVVETGIPGVYEATDLR